jgi:hypothetical protein
VAVQQERFHGMCADLNRLSLEVSDGLDWAVRRDHDGPTAEVVAVNDVIVDLSGHHVVQLVRVEVADVSLGDPGVGLNPEPVGFALGNGRPVV